MFPSTPGLESQNSNINSAAHAELQQELSAKTEAAEKLSTDNAALVAKVAALEEAVSIAAVHAEGKDAIIASLESTGDGSKEVVELTAKLHKMKVASAMQLAPQSEHLLARWSEPAWVPAWVPGWVPGSVPGWAPEWAPQSERWWPPVAAVMEMGP